MNTTRFYNFAKYDLATNKVFYRNMAIMAFGIGAGISALAFLFRFLIFNSKSVGLTNEAIEALGYASYTNSTATNVILAMLAGFLLVIFPGCTFHSLRKKQGRINELTLPASNQERFTWHVLLSVGGGLLLTIGMVLSADLVNYILHLAVYGNDGTFSLTSRVLDIYTFNLPEFKIAPSEVGERLDAMNNMLLAMKMIAVSAIIMQMGAYVYGNSVKYKYNIVLTYVAIAVAYIVAMICFVQIMNFLSDHGYFDSFNELDDIEAIVLVTHWLYALCALLLGLGGLFIWRSYKRYCKAQITSRLNK